MRPVRPSWQALECLLTVAIEIKQTSLAAPRPKADMLDFGPYDDLGSTNQKSVPEVREWMVAHAVQCEPVSAPNSLLTGKRTGKFAFFDHGYRFRRPICVQVQRFSVEFPTQRNRELFRWSSELRSQIRDLPKPNKVRRLLTFY